MYFDFLIKIPIEIKGVTICKRGDKTYVEYTYERKYNPEKKYNVPKRKTIGKCTDSDKTMMYPNDNFIKFFPEIKLPNGDDAASRSSCLRIGTFAVINKIIEEYHLDKLLYQVFDYHSYLILDLAAYSIISKGSDRCYYSDYAYMHPLFTSHMKIYSDSELSSSISEITYARITQFLKLWNASTNRTEKVYVTYKPSSSDCQLGALELMDSNASRSLPLETVPSYAISYNSINAKPLCYDEYSGGCISIHHLQATISHLQTLEYRHVGFILDQGIFSTDVLTYLDESRYEYILMLNRDSSLFDTLIPELPDLIDELQPHLMDAHDTYGITVSKKLYETDTKDHFFHIYQSIEKKHLEQEHLLAEIDRMDRSLVRLIGTSTILDERFLKYFEPTYCYEDPAHPVLTLATKRNDNINKELRRCGCFCLVTSNNITANEALSHYKNRVIATNFFQGNKHYYFNNQSKNLLILEEAKAFIDFIALIIENKMYTALNTNEDSDNAPTSISDSIRELEKLEMIRQLNREYTLDLAITSTQKRILSAFDIDDVTIKQLVEELKGQLADYYLDDESNS